MYTKTSVILLMNNKHPHKIYSCGGIILSKCKTTMLFSFGQVLVVGERGYQIDQL